MRNYKEIRVIENGKERTVTEEELYELFAKAVDEKVKKEIDRQLYKNFYHELIFEDYPFTNYYENKDDKISYIDIEKIMKGTDEMKCFHLKRFKVKSLTSIMKYDIDEDTYKAGKYSKYKTVKALLSAEIPEEFDEREEIIGIFDDGVWGAWEKNGYEDLEINNSVIDEKGNEWFLIDWDTAFEG